MGGDKQISVRETPILRKPIPSPVVAIAIKFGLNTHVRVTLRWLTRVFIRINFISLPERFFEWNRDYFLLRISIMGLCTVR